MNQEDRIRICSTCKNRSFTTTEGLVCGKSGAKPTFEATCTDYQEDAAEKERLKNLEKEAKNPEISGLLAFFIYWVLPLGIALTVLGFFITPRTMEYYSGSIFLILYEIVFFGFYFYFSIYTIYAFIKRKPDAVFIAKYQLIILFVNNLLVLLTGNAGESMLDNPSRLITSSAWCVIFFLYLIFSEDVKDRIPKEERKLSGRNKKLVIISIILPIILFIFSVAEIAMNSVGTSIFASQKNKITQMCSKTSELLPLQVSDEMNWTGLTFDGQTVEYEYEYLDEVYTMLDGVASEAFYTLMSRYQTEMVKFNYSDIVSNNTDLLINAVVRSGVYDIRFKYCSPQGEPLFYVTLSNEELNSLGEESAYITSTESFELLIDAYNALLPAEFVEDCLVRECSYSAEGETLHYEMELVNSTMAQLAGLDQSYMKEFMLEAVPYMSDAPAIIAKMNGFTLSFRFTADCNDWWDCNVTVTNEEYNGL
jgi:hypothetical protein